MWVEVLVALADTCAKTTCDEIRDYSLLTLERCLLSDQINHLPEALWNMFFEKVFIPLALNSKPYSPKPYSPKPYNPKAYSLNFSVPMSPRDPAWAISGLSP